MKAFQILKSKKTHLSHLPFEPRSRFDSVPSDSLGPEIWFFGSSVDDISRTREWITLEASLPRWKMTQLLAFAGHRKPFVAWAEDEKGPVLLAAIGGLAEGHAPQHGGQFQGGIEVQARERAGAAFQKVVSDFGNDDYPYHFLVRFIETTAEEERAIAQGLELAQYRFAPELRKPLPIIHIPDQTSTRLGVELAIAQNVSRHLVNMPPNVLNPVTLSDLVESIFSKNPDFKVEIWDEERLEKERCGLHLAVGQGASTPPRLVHLRYRPKNSSGNPAPIAFVGKGITFDTGGLDLKPSKAMRLMKKDMGGAAALVGVAHAVSALKVEHPCDFYLCLAENAMDAQSMRPSDIIRARNGKSVEIDNTDAEGRLVLADGLDVAINQNPKPRLVIDVATLTGAIKVGLGSGIAGLFSNSDAEANLLLKAAQETGDWMWRMPLFRPYWSALRSDFADQVNSSEGFGGAITAALFLEKFVDKSPWIHLDIYAWADRPHAPLLESGGSGQAVLALVRFLERYE